MSQVGRIGGQVLTDNLLRSGVDLAFETDLLYLKVSPVTTGVSLNEDADPNFGKAGSTSTPFTAIGINTDVPIYDFDVNNNIYTNELTVVTQLAPGNLRFNAPNTISTSVGGIDVYINGSGEIFHDRLTTANLILDGNLISSISNSNIVLDPNGGGTVELIANTNITGNLAVSGNIDISGNLSGQGTLTFGDNQTFDTVTINTDFTQSIIPGDDLTYVLGADAGDSSIRRWAELHTPQWQYITNGAWPGSGIQSQFTTISNQTFIDGVNNKISTIQSNEDIILNPHTGITFIENIKWQNNDITNLLNTPLTLVSTGTGYFNITGTNGMVIPSGNVSQRRLIPELGETRWNTQYQYLECYDGSVWVVATGGGEVITQQVMEDLGFIYSAILG